MKDFPSLADYGATADDFTDNLPAFKAALAQIKSEDNPHLFVPGGGYAMSDTLNLHQPVRIYGPLGGSQFGGARLRFPPNKHGIVVHEWRTTDDGGGLASGDSGLGDAGGSVIEKLTIVGGMAQSLHGPWTNPNATNPWAHGIWIRALGVQVRDVYTGFWSGHGVCAEATSGQTGAIAGNANNFALENVWAYYCQGFGFSVFGNDANAGSIRHCSAISCAQGGFQEFSFLGNAYDGVCHVRDCGMNDPNAGNAPTAACVYNGMRYYVAAGQQDAASITVPGTDSSVWAPRRDMNAQRQWEPGLKWVFGGSYVTNPANEGNNQSAFFGCYHELGQPPAYIKNPAFVVGGNMGANGVTGDGVYITPSGTWGTALAVPGLTVFQPDGTLIQVGTGGYLLNILQPMDASGNRHSLQFMINPNLPGGMNVMNIMVDNAVQALGIALGTASPQDVGEVIINKLTKWS